MFGFHDLLGIPYAPVSKKASINHQMSSSGEKCIYAILVADFSDIDSKSTEAARAPPEFGGSEKGKA